MILSKRHRFIYIGINKTGTTSIESVLSPYRSRYYQRYLSWRHKHKNGGKPSFKHIPALTVRDLTGARIWNSYYTFTFVRNPWARVVSEYTKHRHAQSECTDVKEGFTQWVMAGGNWLARENTMSDFVCDADGKRMVDFIGRIEHSSEEFKTICMQIGIPPAELPRLNRSRNPSAYRDYYTPETRGIVDRWVARDADMFEYSF